MVDAHGYVQVIGLSCDYLCIDLNQHLVQIISHVESVIEVAFVIDYSVVNVVRASIVGNYSSSMMTNWDWDLKNCRQNSINWALTNPIMIAIGFFAKYIMLMKEKKKEKKRNYITVLAG